MTTRTIETTVYAPNEKAWAIGTMTPSKRFRIRRVVWGRLLAREEKREGEVIRRVVLLITS